MVALPSLRARALGGHRRKVPTRLQLWLLAIELEQQGREQEEVGHERADDRERGQQTHV